MNYRLPRLCKGAGEEGRDKHFLYNLERSAKANSFVSLSAVIRARIIVEQSSK